MAKMKGTDIVIKVSVDDATYETVLALNDATMTIDGDNQDITSFGDNWMARLQGLKDASYSISGFFDVADTTGQLVIRAALINGTDLYIQFLPDGTSGFTQKVVPSSLEISSAVDGVSEISMDLEGTDTVSAV